MMHEFKSKAMIEDKDEQFKQYMRSLKDTKLEPVINIDHMEKHVKKH